MIYTLNKFRNIDAHAYSKILLFSFGISAFFWFIIWLEWNNADDVAKIIGPSVVGLISLVLLIPIIIYFPRMHNLNEFNIVDGPYWSSTILGITFYVVKSDHSGKIKKYRVMDAKHK